MIHEVPTGLRIRPTVTIRNIPGKTIRVPARAATLLAGAALLWGGIAAVSSIPWSTAAILILGPAMILAGIAELRPRGKPPLAWIYIMIRHYRRQRLLIHTRTARPDFPRASRRRN